MKDGSESYEWNIINNKENCDELQVKYYEETKNFAYERKVMEGKIIMMQTYEYQKYIENLARKSIEQ